jgi:hypothetical protein
MKKNVRLVYTGKIRKIKMAVDKTNEILSSAEFYDQIRAYKKFDNSALSPDIIAKLMQESDHEIIVKVNSIMPPVASTHYNKITLWRWDFNDNLALGVNYLIYETVNAIDCLFDILNNESGVKNNEQFTAPWVIGAIAEVMVK